MAQYLDLETKFYKTYRQSLGSGCHIRLALSQLHHFVLEASSRTFRSRIIHLVQGKNKQSGGSLLSASMSQLVENSAFVMKEDAANIPVDL